VRLSWIILFSLPWLSCREIEPFDRTFPVDGYELEGVVTTPNGIPLDSVEVQLYYTYRLVQNTPLDTVEFSIPDSTKTLYVAVYNKEFRFVRRLYFGLRRLGPLPRFRWDERNETGAYVPSGVYIIRYVYDTLIVKDVRTVADGHTTAVTDRNGKFLIDHLNLPVGDEVDFYTGDGRYQGTFRIEPEIVLDLMRGSTASTGYRIPLVHNKLTRISLTF
jgi:hypothetical protein